MKFTIPLLKTDVVNGNGIIYPSSTVESMIDQFRDHQNNDRPMYGELGHPDSSSVSLKNVTHVVKDIWVEHDKKHRLPRKFKKKIKKSFGENMYKLFTKEGPGVLMGEIEMVNNKVPRDLIDMCCFRSRGVGMVDNNGEVTEYKLISFDMIPKS